MRVRPQPPRRARARCVRARALLATATDGVSWSQTVDEVSILVPVQPETRGRDVQLDVQPKRMALRVDGKAVLEGSLADAGEVDVLGCFWTMEEAPGGGKHVRLGAHGVVPFTRAAGRGERSWNAHEHRGDGAPCTRDALGGLQVAITLAKRASGYNSWEALLESDKADLSITDRCLFGGVAVRLRTLARVLACAQGAVHVHAVPEPRSLAAQGVPGGPDWRRRGGPRGHWPVWPRRAPHRGQLQGPVHGREGHGRAGQAAALQGHALPPHHPGLHGTGKQMGACACASVGRVGGAPAPQASVGLGRAQLRAGSSAACTHKA